jgi:plastocyanin
VPDGFPTTVDLTSGEQAMRVRNVTTVLGLGALVLVCLTAEPASAQFQPGYAGPANYPAGPTVVYGRGSVSLTGPGTAYYPAGPTVYGQSWQPGSYGAPSYWPGMAYGPGQAYAPSMYQPQATYQAQPMYQTQATYQTQPGYQAQPMYQSQPYAYQAPGAPCPPAQPISPSALTATPPQAMPSGAPGAATAQPGTTTPLSGIMVNAQDDFFQPKTLTIQPGATVTWVNRGQHAHTVTFDVGRDSGDIAPGGSFSATFPHAGTYTYYCRHHKDMRATIVVGQNGGSGSTGGSTGTRY